MTVANPARCREKRSKYQRAVNRGIELRGIELHGNQPKKVTQKQTHFRDLQMVFFSVWIS